MPDRVLIVAPSWVGDAVMSQPLVGLLAAADPAPRVDVLAPAWCGPVFARMPGVAEVLGNPFGHGELRLGARWRLARSLAARGYACAYVLPNSLKSALIPWLAGIPRRVGYVGEFRHGLLTDARRLDEAALPRLVDRFAALASPAPPADGRSAPGQRSGPDQRSAAGEQTVRAAPPPRLRFDPSARTAAVARLGLDASRGIVALCPGAEYGPAKRWPPEYFAEIARRFLAANRAVWVFGSANDAPVAAAIAAQAPGVIDLCGRTGLGEAVDLLSFAALVVTNDSGLMHIAAALERPLVAIFGSSSVDYTPPLSERASIARLGLACSPCFQRECPLGHTNCLRELSPARVHELALARLAGSDAQ